ncbi:unnamed protein product [Cuscuta epithymum]|uniref:Proline dehydrogenase n=1 Tax=Cuscuta epithymum TaxID=186058 RepID=A0AAV0CZK5_9ASTE|nr:unnamed protein product [Cuscuta epithymum]
MATRQPTLLLKNLSRHSRRCLLNSAPSSIAAAAVPPSGNPAVIADPKTATATAPGKALLNLDDAKELFSSVSTTKLLKSSVTLHMTAVEPLVDVGLWVMKSRLMGVPLLRESILGIVKLLFYDHFCGGKDLQEVGRTVSKLSESGLKAMLDYGLEHATDNSSCDISLKEILQTADSVNSLPSSSVSFIVVKITAICPKRLIKRVSDLLRWEFKNPSFHLPWKQKTLPIFCESSPLYHTTEEPEPLSREEEHDLELCHQRLQRICEKCLEVDVPLFIDAEDTVLQPAIDYMAYTAAVSYHREDNPLVFGTVQAYLKDAKERLVRTKKAADKMGIPMGFKLVRGAYMSSERQVASSLGVESPIHNTIHQTHTCFNDCMSFMLDEIANGSGAVVLATHNVESGKMAATKVTDLGMRKDSLKVQFGQLYGMSDALSYSLRNAGFQVSKYLPFGPVDEIMPYLMRRGEENRGVLSASSLDRQLMRNEVKRRLLSTIL